MANGRHLSSLLICGPIPPHTTAVKVCSSLCILYTVINTFNFINGKIMYRMVSLVSVLHKPITVQGRYK